MKIKCDCGEIIIEGEIAHGKKHSAFIIKDKPLGEIHKNNHSNTPTEWSGLCSKCQKIKHLEQEIERSKLNIERTNIDIKKECHQERIKYLTRKLEELKGENKK